MNWLSAIDDAKRGNLAPLIKMLRSERLPQDLQDSIAALFEGAKIKRSRGRPKTTDIHSLVSTVQWLQACMREDRVASPLDAACYWYARPRAIKGKSVLRAYRKAKRG